jgi:hypothetical protein
MADAYKVEKAKQAEEKAKSKWGGFFSSSKNEPLVPEAAVEKLQSRIEQQLEVEEQMSTEYAQKMGSVPKIKINFNLDKFKVTLQLDENNGLQLYTKKFIVDIMFFDTSNKYNRHSIEFVLKNQAFGLDVLSETEKIPFV